MTVNQLVKYYREQAGMSQEELAHKIGYSHKSSVGHIESGRSDIPQSKIPLIASALGITIGQLFPDVEEYSPSVTNDYVTFPVLGDIAAGYEHIAIEEWDGDKIDIPTSYLKRRSAKDYFVLRVKGDSMYPNYMDGDKILVLKQTTCDYSGQVAAVIYGTEFATLKRVNYVMGEDWMLLQPINPAFPPIRVVGADLERCKVIGIPKLLIREM